MTFTAAKSWEDSKNNKSGFSQKTKRLTRSIGRQMHEPGETQIEERRKHWKVVPPKNVETLGGDWRASRLSAALTNASAIAKTVVL